MRCYRAFVPLVSRRNGGSAANVARCFARLRGAARERVKLIGMVGADAAAEDYRQELLQRDVEPLLLHSTSGAPTATCLCLVSAARSAARLPMNVLLHTWSECPCRS